MNIKGMTDSQKDDISTMINRLLIINEEAKEILSALIRDLKPQLTYPNRPLYELELSARSFNALARAKIYTVNDLLALTHYDLKKIRNLGQRCYSEIVEKLEELDLELANE